jgi:hypothetical protein
MAKNQGSNPYAINKTTGAQGTPTAQALVVDIMDPEKTGRVKIRVVGHMDDQQAIPDDKLPWVKVGGGTDTAQMQGSSKTNGLLPGSMVSVEGTGQAGSEYSIKHALPNDRKANQNDSMPKPAKGKEGGGGGGGGGGQDQTHKDDDRHNQQFGWGQGLQQVVENKTTQGAMKLRDNANRNQNRTAEPVKESRDKAKTPKHYGERANSKDAGKDSGTIGTFKWNQEKNAQKDIKSNIQNKSAVVPNALDAMEQLKKVEPDSCPESKQSIGQQNFSQIMSQLSSWFGGGGGGGGGGQQPQEEANTANNDANTIFETGPDPLIEILADLADQAYGGVNRYTEDHILIQADAGKTIELSNASPVTVTVPNNATVAFAIDITSITIVQTGAGTVSIEAAPGVTINSKSGMLDLDGPNSWATLYKRDTDDWMLFGDLTA